MGSERIEVFVRCLQCGASWLTGIIYVGSWWAAGLTPEKVAATGHSCYSCGSERKPVVLTPVPLGEQA